MLVDVAECGRYSGPSLAETEAQVGANFNLINQIISIWNWPDIMQYGRYSYCIKDPNALFLFFQVKGTLA